MIKKYLKLFGITKVEKIPDAFDAQYQEEWKLFQSSFRNPSKDPLRAAFYLCMEFIRYMQAIKIDPLVKPLIDPVTHVTFQVHRAYEVLFSSNLQDFATDITEQFRRLRLAEFKVVNHKFCYRSFRKDHELRYTVIVSNTGRPLTQTLADLSGTLFSSREAPIQLRNSHKLDRAMSLLESNTELGWLKVRSTPLDLWVMRARNDLLVLRFTQSIPQEVVFGTASETKAHILKAWKNVKLVINCK